MKHLPYVACVIAVLLSCNSKDKTVSENKPPNPTDTLTYAYKATYSSDITVPSHPEIAQMVLNIWKMVQNNQIDSVKKYYADTVNYDNSDGMHFHGSSSELLNYAKKDFDVLDSLRFDISMWQSLHINDRNEDWVYIWAAERRYEKGSKADTSLIHEQWKVENGKITYFNQYKMSNSKH